MRTLVIVKPDGVKRGVVGDSIQRFERYGFKLAGIKILKAGEKAEQLYSIHKGKPFYNDLINYINSGPIAVVILDINLPSEDAIKMVRKIVGATNPINAEMGSIRGDYACSISENIVHASDSEESAKKEIQIFFNESELVKY